MKHRMEIDYDRPHYLIITDGCENTKLTDTVKELKDHKLNIQIEEYSDSKNLGKMLSKQPIGCFLLIFVKSNLIHRVIHLAREAHFAGTDIIAFQDSQQRVFCGSCHFINDTEGSRIVCKKCTHELEVSNHFSAYYHAVLGYPVIKKVGVENDE